MVAVIGRSTPASTADQRSDVPGSEPASFRYNNPGAQYPSAQAARFGQIGYGIIGGGHKIARFPSPVNGAAANFDLLYRNYTGMTIGDAGKKWTGAHGFGVPGYNPNSTLTKHMVDDLRQAIDLLKAIAHRESGKGNNLTEEQWRQAHRMFKAGSADTYLDGLQLLVRAEPKAQTGKKTGAGLLTLARAHVGEEYRNILVPKNDPNWKGPWDCAEFMSWLVYQEGGILYGCVDDQGDPATVEAYTGAWKTDVERIGKKVSVAEAAATVGGIVLRYPPSPGKMGHIAICDGRGGTVEAKGRRYGVVEDTVHGRTWHTGVLVPGIEYDEKPPLEITRPDVIYALGARNMIKEIVVAIQQALASRGFNPSEIDGEFGPDTRDAVVAFQEANGLTVDGEVGPETAGVLGVSLREVPPQPGAVQDQVLAGDPRHLITLILTLLSKENPMAEDSAKLAQGIDPAKALLPLLLQSLLTGRQIDLNQLLTAILTGKPIPTAAPTPETVPVDTQTPPSTPDVGSLLLPVLYERLTGNPWPGTPSAGSTTTEPAKPTPTPLTPVNAALGEGIGKVLNGRKTGLGIVGLLATTLLPIIFPELVPVAAVVKTVTGAVTDGGQVASQVIEQAPIQAQSLGPAILEVAKPLFTALTGWGVLGKLDKWFTRAPK